MNQEDNEICAECGKIFKNVYSLNRHTRVVHQQRRPHHCECGKSFATREQLTRHMNSKHTFEKPFLCQKGCSKAFASYTAREYHHRIIHDQLKHECPVFGCNKQYSSRGLLERHMEKPHNQNLMLLNAISWMYFQMSPYWFRSY